MYHNYIQQKLIFQKKTKIILNENNKLKAENYDLKDKLKELKVKDEIIEKLKNDNKILNLSLDIKKKEDDLQSSVVQIAQLKSELLLLKSEKDNLFYFMKELILKIKKKKDNHFNHAFSILSAQDQATAKELLQELGVKL